MVEVMLVVDLFLGVGSHTTQTHSGLNESLIYYPPEVGRGEYLGLGVFLLHYFPFIKI